MHTIDKKQLVQALRARLEESLARLTASQHAAQTAAVHPESKQEHSKDMRATEASYIARGLAERVEVFRDGLRLLELMVVREFAAGEPAASGALVTVADGQGCQSVYLLAPAGGGERLEVDGHAVLVLTPQSPLGSVLAGRRATEVVTAELPNGRAELEIVRVD